MSSSNSNTSTLAESLRIVEPLIAEVILSACHTTPEDTTQPVEMFAHPTGAQVVTHDVATLLTPFFHDLITHVAGALTNSDLPEHTQLTDAIYNALRYHA